MSIPFELLESEALKLATPDRARLAEHLIASLDEDSEIEEAWAIEVARRIADIDSGKTPPIEAAAAIAEVRAALK